jgi:hypothetical protein
VTTINDPLTDGHPTLASNLSSSFQAWSTAELTRTPVLIFVSSPVNPYLPLALETLVRQPFLQARNVLMVHQPQDSAAIEPLADLFGMRSLVLPLQRRKMIQSLKTSVRLLFPEAAHLILLSSQFLLSPDLFLYFAQLLPLLRNAQSTLSGISAWNQNSRLHVSSDERLVYRASSSLLPMQNSFLVRKSLLDKCNILQQFAVHLLGSASSDQSIITESCPEYFYLLPDLSRILFFDQQRVSRTND